MKAKKSTPKVTKSPRKLITESINTPPKVIDLEEIENSTPRGKPIIVHQEMTPLHVKRQEIAHIFYDAKLEDKELIKAQAKEMDWDVYSRVTSRFDTTREVKLDHNITAMGILGLLTGSDD